VQLITKFFLFLVDGIGALPIALRKRIGACFGYVFALIPSKERHFAELQIQRFLFGVQNPNKESVIAKKVFQNIGTLILENFNLQPYLKKKDFFFHPVDLGYVQNKISQNGAIALTAHLGNWDLLGAYMVEQGFTLNVIAREARRSFLHVILVKLRAKYSVKTIWRSEQLQIKKLIEKIQNKEIIAVLIDQDTDVSSIPVCFFGEYAATPVTLVKIAKKFSIPLFMSFLVREGDKFRIIVEEIDTSLPIEGILQRYSERLESLIRQYPSQWVWFHKRWRTTREGYRRSSNEYKEFLSL
jgi:Kdo2-lipid IVA lauroyltransferase/acyltransferase